MARCVICDGILQAYAKLVEEKDASAEKDRLLKVQREHDGDVHSAAIAIRQPASGDQCAAARRLLPLGIDSERT